MDDIPARLANALASRYRIDREIGAGGAASQATVCFITLWSNQLSFLI
jgi:hypothetical protein